MKKLIGIAVFLFFCGCESSSEGNHVEIFNNSGRDVVVTSYKLTYHNRISNSSRYAFSQKMDIGNSRRYGGNFEDCPVEPGINGKKVPFSKLVGGDSISIDYGGIKKGYSSQQYAVETRNPYFLYYANNSTEFVYTLTHDDYTDAMAAPRR